MEDVFEPLLNKNVIVETGSIQVKGKLVYYKPSEKEGHQPFVLVLKAQDRTIVLRSWITIKRLKMNGKFIHLEV